MASFIAVNSQLVLLRARYGFSIGFLAAEACQQELSDRDGVVFGKNAVPSTSSMHFLQAEEATAGCMHKLSQSSGHLLDPNDHPVPSALAHMPSISSLAHSLTVRSFPELTTHFPSFVTSVANTVPL